MKDLKPETLELLQKAVTQASKELLEASGGDLVLLTIRAGYDKGGGGGMGIAVHTLGCQHPDHEHDRRRPRQQEDRPYTGAELAAELLRRLRPQHPQDN